MYTEKIHRGNLIKQLIKSSDNQFKEVAIGCGIGRTTLYNWMKAFNLEVENMEKVITYLGIEPPKEFIKIKLKAMKVQRTENEQLSKEFAKTPQTTEQKYYALLEKHTDTMQELLEVKEELATYKTAPNRHGADG